MSDWRIVRDDLSHAAVVGLLELHDISGLRDPAVTLWTAWEDQTLLGMGALKQLDPVHAEVKSMRTAPAQLRRGVAAALLDHLIAEARGRGYHRLSLETGSNAPFAAAHALYRGAGFVECAPFAQYHDTLFAQYFTKAL